MHGELRKAGVLETLVARKHRVEDLGGNFKRGQNTENVFKETAGGDGAMPVWAQYFCNCMGKLEEEGHTCSSVFGCPRKE